ncbi:lysylphosphatidylglycerol synthase transmembrane domain-containing protein [soil metagenome]
MWPVLIGVLVAGWLFLKEFDIRAFDTIHWTSTSTLWFSLAIISVVIRDFAYMIRIRILTDQQINWYRSFIVIMLWEFSSALAPGMLGGGFLFAILILNKEGVNMGKSITAIMNSSFLDGIFLVVMAPLVYWIAGKEALFSGIHLNTGFGSSIFYTFWTVYFLILAYKLFIAYALFVNPHLIRRALIGLFSFKLLRRWKSGARETGDQLVIASNGLREKNWKYWSTSMAATFASWTARYSIVNCIIHAFHGEKELSDFVIYGKQVVMGIIILLSPTPGGSGLAEFMFNDFLGEFIIKGLAPTLGVLWRMLSYYPYLFIGAIILPRWIRGHIKIDKLKL